MSDMTNMLMMLITLKRAALAARSFAASKQMLDEPVGNIVAALCSGWSAIFLPLSL